ncbi:hypothetical protein [Streptomyces zaomyceticus]|uniref:hypothetical protein n=1 Tax=Streptomyces zaomyceticus TaxID=68286 RepID=UPI0033B03DD3
MVDLQGNESTSPRTFIAALDAAIRDAYLGERVVEPIAAFARRPFGADPEYRVRDGFRRRDSHGAPRASFEVRRVETQLGYSASYPAVILVAHLETERAHHVGEAGGSSHRCS